MNPAGDLPSLSAPAQSAWSVSRWPAVRSPSGVRGAIRGTTRKTGAATSQAAATPWRYLGTARDASAPPGRAGLSPGRSGCMTCPRAADQNGRAVKGSQGCEPTLAINEGFPGWLGCVLSMLPSSDRDNERKWSGIGSCHVRMGPAGKSSRQTHYATGFGFSQMNFWIGEVVWPTAISAG